MISKIYKNILIIFSICYIINASNTKQNNKETNLDPSESIGDIQHDIYLLRRTVKTLEEQINKFGEFYIEKLDQKLTSLAVNMASLESNVRNIQERAHIWDTFQLHVSAWNEQIKSIDQKVTIINRGQEKVTLLDGKLSFLLNLEYNSQRALNKLSNLEERFDMIEKSLKNSNSPRTFNIYDEFAVMGVLSTLKNIEYKSDRTNVFLYQLLNGNGGNLNDSIYHNQRKVSTCALSQSTDEIIKDVSSKVDIIHDKITENEEEEFENKGQNFDYSTESYPSNTIKSRNNKVLKKYEQLLNVSNDNLYKLYNEMEVKNDKIKKEFLEQNQKSQNNLEEMFLNHSKSLIVQNMQYVDVLYRNVSNIVEYFMMDTVKKYNYCLEMSSNISDANEAQSSSENYFKVKKDTLNDWE